MPSSLRFLKVLVIILLCSMIAGVIAVVWLLVTRLPVALSDGARLPAAITLPAEETAQAVTFGPGYVAVVTQSGRILLYGKDGSLRQDVMPQRAPAQP